jgi:endoglucanase
VKRLQVLLFFLMLMHLQQLGAAEPAGSFGGSTLADSSTSITYDRGCIIRGPRSSKRLALEFTGGSFADGGTTILDTLKQRRAKASFFFIGDFFRKPDFSPLVRRILDEGHYLGPHSDKHPLYASWEHPPELLISRQDFDADLERNMQTLAALGVGKSQARYFIPPYEHYTPEISEWTKAHGMVLINYTPGTRSHADYMEDSHKNFISSADMVKSVLNYEEKDPYGLNGFLLLMHIGAGPGRTRDKLYNQLGEMMDELTQRGYTFVRVDELLDTASVGQ